jgi:hypothetical protein
MLPFLNPNIVELSDTEFLCLEVLVPLRHLMDLSYMFTTRSMKARASLPPKKYMESQEVPNRYLLSNTLCTLGYAWYEDKW